MVIAIAPEAVDVTPPDSCTAVTDHTPSASSGKLQLATPAALSSAEMLQVSVKAVGEDLVAVSSASAPETKPVRAKVGVASEVKLSVELIPKSDSVARSGVERAGSEIMPVAGEVVVTLDSVEKAVFVPVTTERMK
jgi:hypothetical protein